MLESAAVTVPMAAVAVDFACLRLMVLTCPNAFRFLVAQLLLLRQEPMAYFCHHPECSKLRHARLCQHVRAVAAAADDEQPQVRRPPRGSTLPRQRPPPSPPMYDPQHASNVKRQSMQPIPFKREHSPEIFDCIQAVMRKRSQAGTQAFPSDLVPAHDLCTACDDVLVQHHVADSTYIWTQYGPIGPVKMWCLKCPRGCPEQAAQLYDGREDALFVLNSRTAFSYELLFGHLDDLFYAGKSAAAFYRGVLAAGYRYQNLDPAQYEYLRHHGSRWRRMFTVAVTQFISLRWNADPRNGLELLPLCPKCGEHPWAIVADAKTQGMPKSLSTFLAAPGICCCSWHGQHN